ncbi:MAG: glycosyltransferase family 4 protein [Anaerolineae bacterium]|nr:glycosyltransferase family 4 protein [Anaerolineae bacterium]
MRVLMLSWEYPPHLVGGLGKHVTEIIPALVRQGVQIDLLTPRWAGGDQWEIVAGATIHRVDPGATNGNVYTTAWQTNVTLEQYTEQLWSRSGGFDLIHAHDWLVAFVANALKRKYRVPLLATIHATEKGRGRGNLGSDISHAIHSAEWWLTYEAWRVVACSAYMAQEIIGYFGVPAEKVDIVPNGVDVAPFQQYDGVDLTGFRAMYALPEEQIVFNVGRIVAEKGVQVLIEAVPRVLAAQPQAKFVIAGRGDMVDGLRRRAWESGVGQKILFCGYISNEDRNRLYRVAHCAVFPSLYEPFGMVALEAMAARCPVVVSDVGGLREVVRHGETGITTYVGNPDSLAWGILHTLQHPEWTAQRVQNAARVVTEEYNWDRIAQQTVAVYQRILSERAAAAW